MRINENEKLQISKLFNQILDLIIQNNQVIWIDYLKEKSRELESKNGEEYDKLLLEIDKSIGGMGSLTDLDMKKNDDLYQETLNRFSIAISSYLLENSPQLVNFSTKRKIGLYLQALWQFFKDIDDKYWIEEISNYLIKFVGIERNKDLLKYCRKFKKLHKKGAGGLADLNIQEKAEDYQEIISKIFNLINEYEKNPLDEFNPPFSLKDSLKKVKVIVSKHTPPTP